MVIPGIFKVKQSTVTFLKGFEKVSPMYACNYYYKKNNEELVKAIKEGGDISIRRQRFHKRFGFL